MRSLDWCQNQRPWMALKGRYALYIKTYAMMLLLIYSFTFSLLLDNEWLTRCSTSC